MISALNKATGEVIELPADTLEEVTQAWQTVQQYDKAITALKEQLKKKVRELADQEQIEEVNNTIFRVTSVQRMTYDKSVLRRLLDEDTLDVFLEVKKTAVDNYLKENIDDLRDVATEIRSSMVASGDPYEVIKLEKL